VLDVDSTLTGIEGIDWLAERRGGETAAFVRRLTEDAMSGRLALEDAYGLRLGRIAPTMEEVRALARAYRAQLAAGAGAAIEQLRSAGVRVIAISGGLREAVVPVCREVALADEDVFAVAVHWDARGMYAGFDHTSPLATQGGKGVVLRGLALPRPILAVGDGSTDLAMRTSGEADAFAAYTGFVCRASVVAAADRVLTSFPDLVAFVLPPLA
jgi:phosphoserine phosphatase